MRNCKTLSTGLKLISKTSTQTKPRRLFFGGAADHPRLQLYPLSLKLNGSNRLGCWVLCFPPIYHSPPPPHIEYILAVTSQRFYLLNQLKKMSLSLAGLNSVFRALIVHVLNMLYQLFMGLFYRATLIASTPCLEKPSDGVL